MDNKQLGVILIIVCALVGGLIFSFNQQINAQLDSTCGCEEMENGGFCPHEEKSNWQTYSGVVILSAIFALGIYLIFFDKGQKAILSTLEKQKKVQTEEEKFNILLKGMDADERKVIKAVKNQDGITQQTLRLRADMHKSKLSIVLDGLEKKGLVKRVVKGKTKQVFLKVGL